MILLDVESGAAMWPFGKKKVTWVAAEDRWSVAKGENNGKPIFLRVSSSAKQFAGHPDFPVRFGVAVPLQAPDENGLPQPMESQQLGNIEDQLFQALGSSGRLVLIITTGGMREFVSYVRSPELAERVFERVRNATKTHELRHYTASDPIWELFGQFA
jgi:hypothetical protein